MNPNNDSSPANQIPVEVEIYINTDGSVTFADLAAEVIPIALALNPNDPVQCELPEFPQVDKPQS
jgi:hypothetical protein